MMDNELSYAGQGWGQGVGVNTRARITPTDSGREGPATPAKDQQSQKMGKGDRREKEVEG